MVQRVEARVKRAMNVRARSSAGPIPAPAPRPVRRGGPERSLYISSATASVTASVTSSVTSTEVSSPITSAEQCSGLHDCPAGGCYSTHKHTHTGRREAGTWAGANNN